MAFIPPIKIIRMRRVVKKLRESGAVSAETAKTLVEAGIKNPNRFSRFTDRMVRKGIIKKTHEGKYYID